MVQYIQWWYTPISGCEEGFFCYENMGEWYSLLLNEHTFTP